MRLAGHNRADLEIAANLNKLFAGGQQKDDTNQVCIFNSSCGVEFVRCFAHCGEHETRLGNLWMKGLRLP